MGMNLAIPERELIGPGVCVRLLKRGERTKVKGIYGSVLLPGSLIEIVGVYPRNVEHEKEMTP